MKILERIRTYLGDDDLETQQTDFGYIVTKPLYRPSKHVASISIGGHALNFGSSDDRVAALDEHVLMLERRVPIGEYPTVREEIIVNIGDTDIVYLESEEKIG